MGNSYLFGHSVYAFSDFPIEPRHTDVPVPSHDLDMDFQRHMLLVCFVFSELR
jgi:hypothetical protein